MSEISELQSRIATALDRIGAGVERLDSSAGAEPGDTSEVDALRAQLEEERTANAQLEERVRTIKDTQDGTVERLTSDVERLSNLLSTQEETVARLARANEELRKNNGELRKAISDGVAEPHLVNKAMMTELEALRVAQSADRAEIDAVLGELNAMIEAGQGKEAEDA
ncbi:hypothetical protein [Maritimibacter dapengensis]|uniref:Uncharacterized protein n=1 Tax=Maritimibacter dapengensis TaxID=2836868 RepID=A0ABS6T1Z4_9RHOB|nr:hypothetical protein [Maritimibacter dapengensis]MBV7379273.1 hypothetical protein [Maritimibacter dapengensis]